ncbi:MAG: class I SAM-dependent DNA methyltransferase [Anaerolineales bacterium]|nr:class I SAM-dependent DNA methyltransferase [Anaerolineales bacterium]
MTPHQFVQKWSQILLNEIAMAQSHFNDVCALIGHKTPTDADPTGEFFTFEASVQKAGGGGGRADVWYKSKFIWEYKGAHADLDKAYQQLLLYRESLGNPPLLITSDTKQILIHTNFTNTVKKVYTIDFEAILSGQGVELLRRAFHDPESFRPEETQEAVTRASADAFIRVARTLQDWAKAEGRQEDPERLAHFLIRLLFALFAEDMKLLPEMVFTKLVEAHKGNPANFRTALRGLFSAMRDGQMFGFYAIRYFNGGLFDDDYVPDLPGGILHDLAEACLQNWASLEPSIFGTLFERVIDESKRAQLGAHYTSKDDIMLIVEPVLMQPLREEWQGVRAKVSMELNHLGRGDALRRPYEALNDFATKLANVRILDPACGSGNFLYVALRQLLDLQKEVIVFAGRNHLPEIPLTVSPHQLYGIEINPYAHELAQITVWIGYLQWRLENGFAEFPDPVLRPLKNIENKDAILAYDAEGKPVEPEWPEVDVVIGNPPFLGSKKFLTEFEASYVENLRKVYSERMSGFTDLVVYWFEYARLHLTSNKVKRVGLLATNSIRTPSNRKVLERIKEVGEIFMAWSDRAWIQDGAAVRVSMIAFDNGKETNRILDGKHVKIINADLSASADITQAKTLPENLGFSFVGPQKDGPLDIPDTLARKFLALKNDSGKENSEVVKPYINGSDIVRNNRFYWIIDFESRTLEEAKVYEAPFQYVEENLKPLRKNNRDRQRRENWWRMGRSGGEYRTAVQNLPRQILTCLTAKHRLFIWASTEAMPANTAVAIARDDDYFFGVLQSSLHEIWSIRKGTSLGVSTDPRYIPSSTFETFPFPWPPGKEPSESQDPRVFAIAEAARQLDAFRNAWLFPPENEIGVTISESMLKKRTLTNLYNALTDYREKVKGKHRDVNAWYGMVNGIIGLDEIETLDHIHNELDRAVLSAYGWPHHLSDEEILGRLLEENLRRAG